MKTSRVLGARRGNRPAGGLTLIELMITMAIFVGLATVMLSLVTWVVKMWSHSERRRVLYERAGGAVERVADDLRLTVGCEPAGVDEVRARFFGDLDPETGFQRVMFVRSFEAGPERAMTFNAGDGLPQKLRFRPEIDQDGLPQAVGINEASDRTDGDIYTGTEVGDFKALGGMAQIGYSMIDRVLYRSVRAPAIGAMTEILPKKTVLTRALSENAQIIQVEDTRYFPGGGKWAVLKIDDEWIRYRNKDPKTFEVETRGYRNSTPQLHNAGASVLWIEMSTPIIDDCLYLRFDYWSQYTESWDEVSPKTRTKGTEKIWDSTRGVETELMRKFIQHRGKVSLDDPTDDVFPQKVRITLTVDSPMPRCVFTKLEDRIGPDEGKIVVDSTRGFREGGTPQSYILIGEEWIHYKAKTYNAFIADVRGARGAQRADHDAEDVVRAGQTFRRVVFIPGYREDWEPDQIYLKRLENIEASRRNR